MHPSEVSETDVPNADELGAVRGVEARRHGLRMIRIGVVICVLSTLGLQLQFGKTGTLAVGGAVLLVGVGALVASLSPRSANLATFLVQTALWTVIVALVLIVVASIVGFVYFVVVALAG